MGNFNFAAEIQTFIGLSFKIGDTWDLHKDQENDVTSWFAKKKQTVEININQQGSEEIESNELEDDDISCYNAGTSLTGCCFEYHIVYSASYDVPVLYFNAYKPNGCLLSLDELWQNIPLQYQERLHLERWTFLTQQEHPLLHRPFFQLHPCRTADLMDQAPQSDANYIVKWLSAVGPVVHLNLSLSYATLQNSSVD